MGKMKEVSLSHKGFKITGTAYIEMASGRTDEVQMDSFFLTRDKLTPDNIKRSINDAKSGSKRITSANIHIYDVYISGYTQFNRSIRLNTEQCQEACLIQT